MKPNLNDSIKREIERRKETAANQERNRRLEKLIDEVKYRTR